MYFCLVLILGSMFLVYRKNIVMEYMKEIFFVNK